MKITPSTDKMIKEFSRFPGIGTKSAQTLSIFLLKYSDSEIENFISAIRDLKNNVRWCSKCYNISENELCDICSNENRDNETLCVVESFMDVISIENTCMFNGLYHVLHGRLSPINGIGPEDLKIKELIDRVEKKKIRELLLATNTDIEGEATGLFILNILSGKVDKITRLATGLPIGSQLQYTDSKTLSLSLHNREIIKK